MSSSFVADTSEQKSDSSVVIVLNEDGSVSLDEQTLQKLFTAKNLQQPLSVVRMNQGGSSGGSMSIPITQDVSVVTGEGQPEVNLTVEGFFSPSTVPVETPSSADPLNAFMQMDPDQLEKLENALQSEEAKQILGESMLDMLTSKDEKTEAQAPTKATSIQLDHCYTGSSQAGNVGVSEDETDSEEEVVQRGRGRGKARVQRGGKTIPSPAPARTRAVAAQPVTRKVTRAQPAPPPPPPESKPPDNLTKLGQSPAKTLLRTAKASPVKKEEKPPTPVVERKVYPQRTNRKPPAHLAEAFGASMFSSPEPVKKLLEVAKKDPEPEQPLVLKEESEPESPFPLDIITKSSAQALLEPEVIQELQNVLGDLGPEVLKPLEEAKAEMEEALQEEAEEAKLKEQTKAIEARRRSSSSKAQSEDDSSITSLGKPGRTARKPGLSKVTSDAIKDLQAASDEEEESDEEGDEEWDSEDDPDKLWCICRKPHNNRFMICCDKCEDWFHGQCVGITKAMGKQMEAQGKEWTCPKCKKLLMRNEPIEKVTDSAEKPAGVGSPVKIRRTSSTSSTATGSPSAAKKSPKALAPEKTPEKAPGSKLIQKRPEAKKLAPLVIESPKPAQVPAAPPKKVPCLVCKKLARPSSIYCSDDCILVHAHDSLNLLKKEKVLTPTTPKAGEIAKSEASVASPPLSTENRVLMFEQKTGRILAGSSAPTEATLKTWLKEHPTFQVCKPNLVANIRQKLQDKTQLYIKPHVTPKAEQKAVSILGLPMKSPKLQVPGVKNALLIPSQRLPQTGKSPATPTKTVKTDIKSPPAAGTKIATAKVVTKAPSTPLKPLAPKPAVAKDSSPASSKSTPDVASKKQSSSEATRLNVRNSLQDVFKTKMTECKELKVSENELKGIATSIEEELYALFKDVGTKYKAKFRTIHFNVKDPKNITLFKKIVTGEYSPHQLVRLSSEDLASKELAEWREQEEKHMIEMIKKTEMDLIQQNVTYIKTHKGEQIIETDDSLKLQTDAVEAESAVEPTPDSSTVEEGEQPAMRPPSSSSSSHSKTKTSSKDRDHHRHHHKSSKSSRHHDSKKHSSSSHKSSHSSDKSHSSKDRSKESSKDKDHSKSKDESPSKSSNSSRKHSRHSSSDHKSREASESGDKSSRSSSSLSKTSDHKSSKEKTIPVSESLSEKEREIMEKLAKSVGSSIAPVIATEEETLSDREPSSTVIIKTPESIPEDTLTPIWKGVVSTVDASNFHVSISEVSGIAPNFGSEFPKICDIVGRISSDTVWDYISKLKKIGSKEIMVVRLNATSLDDKQNYNTYYNYLLTRKRFGVVGKKGPSIKDFYIMPLPAKSPVPQILLPFDGPGFEENRPNLLLGVIVQMQRKRSASTAASSGPTKVSKSSNAERSYTPPLPGAGSKSYTPPPPRSHTPPLPSTLIEPYSPTQPKITRVASLEDDEPYSPTGGLNSDDDTPNTSSVVSTLEELNRKIAEETLRIESISSELVCNTGTGPFGEPIQVASFLTSISSDVIKSQPSGIPGLSETLVESAGATLKASVAVDKPEDENEAYSPSRSFTPPSQAPAIPFLPDPSAISLPSNLQEILASIQKKPSMVPESSSMGMSLDCDPIVRAYADDDIEEPGTPPLDDTTRAILALDEREQMEQAPAPVAPRSQPVLPPGKRRDPRQKPSVASSSSSIINIKENSNSRSALSKLSEAELIAKANEMLMAQEGMVVPPVPFPPQTGFPPPMQMPQIDTRLPPPTLPPMPTMAPMPSLPPAFDLQPPPPGADFKDQDMRQMDNERKGISFKVTKRPNLPRWDRKRQDDWDTDGSGSTFGKRPRLSPPPK